MHGLTSGCSSACTLDFEEFVDERIVGRKPKKLDFAQAAAMPLTSITAWEAFFDRMKVQAGKRILVISGAGDRLRTVEDVRNVALLSRAGRTVLLRDVGDEPGALPLLSHALLETWRRRRGSRVGRCRL